MIDCAMLTKSAPSLALRCALSAFLSFLSNCCVHLPSAPAVVVVDIVQLQESVLVHAAIYTAKLKTDAVGIVVVVSACSTTYHS
jgi:hypothetical protein